MDLSDDFKMALKRNDYNLIKSFLDKGHQAYSTDSDGQTPLHFTEKKEVAELLIAHGADVNAKSKKGIAPLHLADNPHTVRFLIEQGADVNDIGYLGNTPLHSAAFYGDLEVVKILLENGADCRMKNDQQLTPIELAQKNGHLEVIVVLQEQEIDTLMILENKGVSSDFKNIKFPYEQSWLLFNLSERTSLAGYKDVLKKSYISFKENEFKPLFPRKPFSRIQHTGIIEGDGNRKVIEVYTYFNPENQIDFQRIFTLNSGNETYPLLNIFESFSYSQDWQIVSREKHPEDSNPMADIVKVENKFLPVWVRISRGLTIDIGWKKNK